MNEGAVENRVHLPEEAEVVQKRDLTKATHRNLPQGGDLGQDQGLTKEKESTTGTGLHTIDHQNITTTIEITEIEKENDTMAATETVGDKMVEETEIGCPRNTAKSFEIRN